MVAPHRVQGTGPYGPSRVRTPRQLTTPPCSWGCALRGYRALLPSASFLIGLRGSLFTRALLLFFTNPRSESRSTSVCRSCCKDLSVSYKSRPSQPKHGNLEPVPVEECTFRRDTFGPSSWRKPIRAGGVKLTQASSAALRDLGSYAANIISLGELEENRTVPYQPTIC